MSSLPYSYKSLKYPQFYIVIGHLQVTYLFQINSMWKGSYLYTQISIFFIESNYISQTNQVMDL